MTPAPGPRVGGTGITDPGLYVDVTRSALVDQLGRLPSMADVQRATAMMAAQVAQQLGEVTEAVIERLAADVAAQLIQIRHEIADDESAVTIVTGRVVLRGRR